MHMMYYFSLAFNVASLYGHKAVHYPREISQYPVKTVETSNVQETDKIRPLKNQTVRALLTTLWILNCNTPVQASHFYKWLAFFLDYRGFPGSPVIYFTTATSRLMIFEGR
jgi:hypothetical protein